MNVNKQAISRNLEVPKEAQPNTTSTSFKNYCSEREGAVSAMKAIVKVAADPHGDEGRDARAHVHSDATRGDGTAHAGAAL
jgi:hypothetical protein